MLVVLKFGGTSLGDAQRLRRAGALILAHRQTGADVVVTASAQGHTTDYLVEQAGQITAHPTARELDALLVTGEQMSAALLAMTLEELGHPAVSLTGWQAGLRTDGTYGNARITGLEGERLRQELGRGYIPVVTGFQGLGSRGDMTTLGRGGSDTTAVALAGLLQAEECRIYTDVDGVYDRDPRKFEDARKFSRISYDHMLELIDGGAQVLHRPSVELAKTFGLELWVQSTFRELPGTLVWQGQTEYLL